MNTTYCFDSEGNPQEVSCTTSPLVVKMEMEKEEFYGLGEAEQCVAMLYSAEEQYGEKVKDPQQAFSFDFSCFCEVCGSEIGAEVVGFRCPSCQQENRYTPAQEQTRKYEIYQ